MKQPMVSYGNPPQVMTLEEFLARPHTIPSKEAAAKEKIAQAWEPAGKFSGC